MLKGRTDLAVELQEDMEEMEKLKDETIKDISKEKGVKEKEKEKRVFDGIIIEERQQKDSGIKETKITVENKNGEKLLKKPIGTYITIEGEDLSDGDEDYHRPMARAVAGQLKNLLKGKENILVAGLGNREITPDALGPFVIDNLYITRHLLLEGIISKKKSVSAFVPGVMAQTGIETVELIETVTKKIKPDVLLVIDALAARNASRLNTTIQISDTGIVPGSGVGNHRNAITKETLGVPVIAIGVPTVISVPAILYEAMEVIGALFKDLPIGKRMEAWSEEEKRQLSYEVCNERLADMFVTPKNVDEAMKRMSYTISEAINAYIMEV